MAKLIIGGAKSNKLKTPYNNISGATFIILSNVKIS